MFMFGSHRAWCGDTGRGRNLLTGDAAGKPAAAATAATTMIIII